MKFKRGMTLAETLMIFIVMGIIASLTIISVKPWDRIYKHIYSRIYNALSITMYNDMVNTTKFPEDISDLSRALLTYMNTVDNHNYDASDSSTWCPNLGPTPRLSDFYNGSDPQNHPIELSNGVLIWCGAKKTGVNSVVAEDDGKPFEYHFYDELGNTDEETYGPGIQFYIVYADLNGVKAPNDFTYGGKRQPDIVAFAITNRSVVVPLGYPTIDMSYLQAHYVIPASSESVDEEDIVSDPMSYLAAQIMAYGRDRLTLQLKGEAEDPAKVIISTSEPNTLELQMSKDLDWANEDLSIKVNAADNYKSPFFVDWDWASYESDPEGAYLQNLVLKIATNVASNERKNLTWHGPKSEDDEENEKIDIDPSCEALAGTHSPTCSIKIYDYH